MVDLSLLKQKQDLYVAGPGLSNFRAGVHDNITSQSRKQSNK